MARLPVVKREALVDKPFLQELTEIEAHVELGGSVQRQYAYV